MNWLKKGIPKSETIDQLNSHIDLLLQEKIKYKSIFNNAKDAIFILKNNKLIEINDIATEMFGYTLEEFKNRRIDHFSPKYQPNGTKSQTRREEYFKAVKDKDQLFDWVNIDKEGNRFYTQISMNYFKILEDKFMKINIRDVKDIKTLEQQLRQAQKMEAIGNLASQIAHDFNNILGGIMGQTELLIEDNQDFKIKNFEYGLNEIMKSSKRGINLIKQLATFQRNENLSDHYEIINLESTINDFENELRNIIKDRSALQIEYGNTETYINMKTESLYQIVSNLVKNSSDALQQKGNITLETEKIYLDREEAYTLNTKKGNYAKISVIDNGEGMNLETKKKIFEPFFSTKPKEEGTGLGMSIIYRIVTESQGKIDIQSHIDKGTRIDIYIPCTKQ